ncbi:hypothetical protein LCGC14_1620590 [marine sediment metagenome]|uniref:Uncharacterized protein n=2 Tax=root TaxID=1 RepID=A0A0F9ISG8_9ZZZZ|nr:MAG: hypothetical protein LCMAC202_04370 [Marseillevirus LCMAC202]
MIPGAQLAQKAQVPKMGGKARLIDIHREMQEKHQNPQFFTEYEKEELYDKIASLINQGSNHHRFVTTISFDTIEQWAKDQGLSCKLLKEQYVRTPSCTICAYTIHIAWNNRET